MSIEKRRHPRIPLLIPGKVKVVFPEYTFTPICHDGMIVNISKTGMKFQTFEVDVDTYKMLLKTKRFVKIYFTPPRHDRHHVLFGQIVWLDYNNKRTPPVANYGIFFEKLSDEDKEAIQSCINYGDKSEEENEAHSRSDGATSESMKDPDNAD